MRGLPKLLMSLSILAASSGVAAGDAAERGDRLGDAAARALPLGTIFDGVAAGNEKWPAHQKPGSVDATQLACLRRELSTEGYRRLKRSEAHEYARRNPSRVDADTAVVEGAAPLFGRLVLAGLEEGTSSKAPEEVLREANGEQLMAFVKLVTDPSMAPVRDLVGIGEAFNVSKSQDENEKAGEQLGTSLALQTMLKANITCKVPPGAFL